MASKDAALAGVVAELANQSWPPGAAGHQLLDWAPLIALRALETLCPGVDLGRLARCLGLDPVDGPAALRGLDQTDAWPARAYQAALATLPVSA